VERALVRAQEHRRFLGSRKDYELFEDLASRISALEAGEGRNSVSQSQPGCAEVEPQLQAQSLLVPREPTREMWAAAGTAVVRLQERNIGHHDSISDAVWSAMIAAAPPGEPPTPASGPSFGNGGGVMIKLLPCPFCGGPAREPIHYNGTLETGCAGNFVDCAGTDVLVPLAMWNLRAAPASPESGPTGHLDDPESLSIPTSRLDVEKLARVIAEAGFGKGTQPSPSEKDAAQAIRSFLIGGDEP
jgi:hypothetical protein